MKLLTSLFATFFLVPFLGYSQVTVVRDAQIENLVTQISRDSLLSYTTKLVSFHSRHNLTVRGAKDRGLWAAAEWAKVKMEQVAPAYGGRLKVDILTYSAGGTGERLSKKMELPVVVATIKGADSDSRVVLVSAHLDSRAENNNDPDVFAPGANDDGSGVSAILEMVRLLSGIQPLATIKLMLVSGEEHGLYGAKFMAELAKSEGWNVVGMLNNDMIGNSGSSETMLNDNMRLRVFSEGVPAYETEQMAKQRRLASLENDGKARQLARYIKEVGERYVDQLDVTLVFRNDRFGRGGDHSPFCNLGFTAVRLTEFNENYDRTHQNVRMENGIAYGDMPSGVDFDYLKKNTGINLSVIANLALAPNDPEEVRMDISKLTNKTALFWKTPTKGKAPAGYYVLIRETYQPLWQKKIYTTATSITLPYSKDNYIFAVQSVDDAGHESIPTIPTPDAGRSK